MRVCELEGCNELYRCKGYCNRHYQMHLKYGFVEYKENRSTNTNIIIIKKTYALLYCCQEHLDQDRCIYIDIKDAPFVEVVRWYIDGRDYVTNDQVGKLHNYVLGRKGDNVDVCHHKNHNTLDNRRVNLRIINHQLNCFKQVLSKNNTSGKTGVVYNKKLKKWQAQIKFNYNNIRLGLFINKNDAIKTREEAEIKYFGELAVS